MISLRLLSNIYSLSTPEPHRTLSSAPPKLPELELLERIGSGAYGEVWLARNTATGARRAVKIVYRATFTDERPFNREFEGIKKFESISHSHPSQLAVFQVGKNDAEAYFYYAMELADSAPNAEGYRPLTLRAKLEEGRLPAERVLELAVDLTLALAHLHSHVLIHRDVKPSNIIFVNGRPKLADIGLVTDASDSRSIVGTEGYLGPEGPGTPAADIYALGKVLYEALTGLDRRQFPELPAELRQWPDHRQAIELNEIVLKACAKEPARRYQTADAMLADLNLLERGKSVQKRRALQWGWSVLWKVAALMAIFSLGIPLVNNERQRRKILADQNKPEWEKSGTTNAAAWQAGKRAMQMGSTYTTVGLSNAIAEWEHATELDPNYLGAWSTLSVTITIAVGEGHLPGTNYLPRAIKYARKAVELNPLAGFPYESLAQARLSSDYDFSKAEPLFRKAIALDPGNWISCNNFAWDLIYEGRFEEGAGIWKRINQEQPQKANPYFGLGIIAYNQRNVTNALALFDEGIRLAPDRPLWHSIRADYLWAAGQKTLAAHAWLREIELGGFFFLNRVEDFIGLANVLKQQGPDDFLSAFVARLEFCRQQGQFVSGFDIARLYAHAGKKSEALDNLEIAIHELRAVNRSVLINPAFWCLKEEPRFREALRRLNLEK